MGMTVSELAQQSGVPTDTIRYWEKAGLLSHPPRSSNGYRAYEPATTERIQFILGAQRAGLRLREIGELLEIQDRGACPCGHTQHVVTARIAEVDDELARLQNLRQQLVALRDANQSCLSDDEPPWPCEDHLVNLGGGEHP